MAQSRPAWCVLNYVSRLLIALTDYIVYATSSVKHAAIEKDYDVIAIWWYIHRSLPLNS